MSDDGAVYLVTGFPNFRARKLLGYALHAEPRATFELVVHEKLRRDADAALAELRPEERARVTLHDGDAAAIDLGLSGEDYRALAARVTLIHHLAQVTYPGATRQMAESLNVGAMREVIELGRLAQRLKRIVVYSSAFVSGGRTGTLYEDELERGQTFRTDVEETLARAERMARHAMDTLPISVLRPTQIVGDSTTGEVDRFDGPYLVMVVILSSPQELPVILPGKGDTPINLVPIDFVVRAAHYIGNHPDAAGQTFHIADPAALPARRVFELVARTGGRRVPQGFIPSNIARAVLATPGVSQVTKSPRALVELMATRARFDTRNADALLTPAHIVCPPFEQYVGELVTFVQRRIEERRAQRSGSDEAEHEDPLA